MPRGGMLFVWPRYRRSATGARGARRATSSRSTRYPKLAKLGIPAAHAARPLGRPSSSRSRAGLQVRSRPGPAVALRVSQRPFLRRAGDRPSPFSRPQAGPEPAF